jgi:hypothetical protein
MNNEIKIIKQLLIEKGIVGNVTELHFRPRFSNEVKHVFQVEKNKNIKFLVYGSDDSVVWYGSEESLNKSKNK